MEFVDLETGFGLLGFADYAEFKRVRQLCQEKRRHVAYAGEWGKLREIQARHWVKPSHSGYIDYHYPWQDFFMTARNTPVRPGLRSGLESLATAVKVLGEKCGYEVKYVLVVRK
ncbi:hypothetical protein CLV24_11459 [Pontibacter ummariensis]|uniref:Uncharacterized protein n=1 Tax=Pontibacter ummariensis TaxID=1610492 RepID=A0A239HND7_9BACT|nr:hypothetical protein [Pontibacter ummariensis]PRY10331.1 hypothetical protein CLV24_11459 [Pontibacter ummariensis]SNS82413.1 hypothetical protein SAMN06296052_11459 [Pontibacter ummariensis]